MLWVSISLTVCSEPYDGDPAKYRMKPKTCRNKFEAKIAKTLGPEYQYEPIKLPYRIDHNYIPDFVDVANKRIIETKGRFPAEDRRKMLAVKEQNPDWEITLVFQRPAQFLYKGSKTTYSDWATKNGFTWKKG